MNKDKIWDQIHHEYGICRNNNNFFFFFKKKSSFGYKNEHIKEKIIKMKQDHMKTEEHTQTWKR